MAAVAAEAGEVTLASHTPLSPTTAPTGESQPASVSADGRFVVFVSTAANVVANQIDGNAATDVFLYERATRVVRLVSHSSAGATTAANAASESPVISADGAFVAFQSRATDLVTGQMDVNEQKDVFLFERATGTVNLVSHTPDSAVTTDDSRYSERPTISADGAVVVFGTTQFGTFLEGLRLFERSTDTVTLVTSSPSGQISAVPSADGAFVPFQATASDVVAGQSDVNGTYDVFLFERATGAKTLVSHTPASGFTTADQISTRPSISADGAFVAFQSQAINLVAGQLDYPESANDVFVDARATGTVTLASHHPNTPHLVGDGNSIEPAISADGAFVTYWSRATDLAAGQSDFNGAADVFLFERATGTVTLVSHTPTSATTTPMGGGAIPAISADGGFVAFQSTGTNLVTGQSDGNGLDDVFLFERATGTVTLVSHTPANATTTGAGASFSAALSANGAIVEFVSSANNLVTGQADGNGTYDTFVFQRTPDSSAASPADFDGDGDTDVSVFRPSNGYWFVNGGAITAFGTSGDIPVPGDYDGDGDTDVAVYRPSNGYWFVNGGAITAFGANGDIPLPIPDAIRRSFFPSS